MELRRYLTRFFFWGILSLVTVVSGQTLPISWGPLETARGTLLDILPINGADFYAFRYTGSLIGAYRLNTYNQLAFTSQQRIKPVTETGYANIESSAYFAGNFQVFLSDKTGSTMRMYSQSIREGEKNAPSEVRCSYEDPRLGARPNFKLILSQNQQYLAIIYEIPGRRENRDLYGYVIYDSTFQEIKRGEYLMPFEGNMSTIMQSHLTNSGAYLIAVTEYKDRNDRYFGKSWENFKALHIYKINQDSLVEFKVQLEDKRIDDLKMSSNNSGLVSISGLYGSGKNQGINGIFSVTLNLQIDSILGYKYAPFDMELLQEYQSDAQSNKMNRTTNPSDNPQVYSYKLRQIQSLEDSGQICYLEQYYERQFNNYDSKTGITNVYYYYYYMDILVVKIGSDGSYIWGKRIPKNQISLNDRGPFSSFIGFNNQQYSYILFNDHKKNYEEDGSFTRNLKNLYGMDVNTRQNVVALVKVDLSTGNLDRKTLFSRQELSSIAVPKTMKVDWKNKEVLMYAVNKNREKFGIISFK